MTAMIRNLGNMTKNGLVSSGSNGTRKVVAQLGDSARLRKARVHPIALLSAMRTYQGGHGIRGSSSWTPVPNVVDALNDAFYESFGNVVPTGKSWMLALDVSGSMTCGDIAGVPGLTPHVGAAAMCMVTARVEKDYAIFGFGSHFAPIDITPKMRLDEVLKRTNAHNFGGTDCSLPFTYAKQKGLKFDAFAVYTDSETNSGGSPHAARALVDYRKSPNGVEDAALIVVGMVSNGFSVGDPKDARTMNVVGFDTAAPDLMAGMVRGEF